MVARYRGVPNKTSQKDKSRINARQEELKNSKSTKVNESQRKSNEESFNASST